MIPETFTDYPKAASDNAQKAIDWRNKYGREVVKGGTRIGWTRAAQLAKREAISLDTVKRMAQFNRHRKNSEVAEEYKEEPYKDRGYIAWLIWGGTEGIDWALRTVERVKKMQEEEAKAKFNYDILSDITSSENEISKLTAVLAEAGGEAVSINIASDGGEVFTGLKIAGLIEGYKGKTTSNIYGLAASISTIIALAADEVLINRFAFFMIHNSWSWFSGNKEEVKKQAKVLKEIDNILASVYVAKIKKNQKLLNNSEEETYNFITGLMSKETFLSSAKAIELGLVDGYIKEPSAALESTAISNTTNSVFYNKLPNNFNLNNNMEKKGIFKNILAAFGFGKDEALEALATLDSPQNMEYKEEEEEKKAMEMKEEDSAAMKEKKAMEEKLKAMEEEGAEKDKALEMMKEELEILKEELKMMKEEKEAIVASVETSASYALEGTVVESSIFSPELQKKLNKKFNKAFNK